MTKVYFLLLILGINACTMAEQSRTDMQHQPSFIIGTYTQNLGHVDGKADGIYTFTLAEDSLYAKAHTQTSIENPSYITIDTQARVLYAASELVPGGADSSGYIYSYRIAADGQLQYLNRQPSYGFAPCYVSVSENKQYVMAANYVGGTVVVYPVTADGSLEEASSRLTFKGSGPHAEQEASHPHCIIPAPGSTWIYVADKGTDRVMGFELTTDGQLKPTQQGFIQVAAGAGPRHLAFHPSLPVVYLVNELNSTVDVFRLNPENGALSGLETHPTLPDAYSGFNACADIHVSPDGKHLYASNRGHNSLAIYRIQPQTGSLEHIGWEATQGDFPRNFMITDDGRQVLVANQNTDNIVCFNRDAENGLLNKTTEIQCPTPVCIKALEL